MNAAEYRAYLTGKAVAESRLAWRAWRIALALGGLLGAYARGWF